MAMRHHRMNISHFGQSDAIGIYLIQLPSRQRPSRALLLSTLDIQLSAELPQFADTLLQIGIRKK